jgi:predicted nuclease of predicted toxin-antitoxin system
MPVTPRAVAHLQAAGHDAAHASSIGLSTVSDSELIDVASREGRVIITADLDFPRLIALARADGPGTILRGACGNARPYRDERLSSR